jgi:hypothetical protein
VQPAVDISSPRPLRVAMIWNGSLYAEHLLSEPAKVVLGDGNAALFPLPEGFSAGGEVTLLEAGVTGYELQPVPGMGGTVWRRGRPEHVAGLRSAVAIEDGDYGLVRLGSTSVFFQHVRQVQGEPPRKSFTDGVLPTSLGLSVFLHVVLLLFVFVIAVQELAPSDPLELDNELLRQFLIVPPPEDLPNTIAKHAERELKDKGVRDRDEASGERARDQEGKAGKRDSQARNTQITGKPAETTAQQVRGMGLLGVLSGGRNRAMESALDTRSLDGLLGGLGSAQTVVGQGSGGLSTRGGGVGGGGKNTGVLFGAGELGTAVAGGKGKGRNAGGSGEGTRQASEAQLSLDTAAVKVSGFLSAEQINRVVQANRAAIKYCFEGGLQRNPRLSGSVNAAFRIDRKGAVSTTRVAKSTLADPKVESCILRQIARWKFPEPDGGEVDVVYPFLFRGQ